MSSAAMQVIESDRFAAELNVASGTATFHRGLVNHPQFRELSKYSTESSACELIALRLIELSRAQSDARYENRFDTAMAAYLTVLDNAGYQRLATVAEAIARVPNCWWAAELSVRLLAKVQIRRGSQMHAVGRITGDGSAGLVGAGRIGTHHGASVIQHRRPRVPHGHRRRRAYA